VPPGFFDRWRKAGMSTTETDRKTSPVPDQAAVGKSKAETDRKISQVLDEVAAPVSETETDPKIRQVPDDVALLDLMLEDQENQPELYKSSNYYRVYHNESIPYLRSVGLKDYRTKAPRTISSFGAVDSKVQLDELAVRRLMYYHAERYGLGSSARPLSDVEISRCGNPEDYFEINGRGLTPRSLIYYMRYGYAGRHVDWNAVKVVAELGPGVGTQTEVIAQLHPGISLLLFDIPPQIYVCEAYLRAVFGDRVVSYRQTRQLARGFRPEPGRIYIFGNWHMEILRQIEFDLFWSAACLCATEPDIAENYLSIVNDSPASAAYLMENFGGLFTASSPGQYGVMRKTTMENYRRGLSKFDLTDKAPHHFEDSSLRDEYEHSFWRRRTG